MQIPADQERLEAAAKTLDALADEELAKIDSEVSQLSPVAARGLLVEVIRAFDMRHVGQVLSNDIRHKISEPAFTAMSRGWNLALSLLLKPAGDMRGVPSRESTSESIRASTSFLIRLGHITLLYENAAMLRHGMAGAVEDGSLIRLRMSDRVATDHYLDRLEDSKVKNLHGGSSGHDPEHGPNSAGREKIDRQMGELLFPFSPGSGKGLMVGYNAHPDVDDHFLSLVGSHVLQCRDEAGIHPDAEIGGIRGSELTSIYMLITSFYLKHIYFVDLAKKKHPSINYAMSLTIWKSPESLVESIVAFTGMNASSVVAALDLITARPTHCEYFRRERTPYVPMLIEIAPGYLLAPISSIFRNSLSSIRMFHESSSEATSISVRGPRENWMIVDLCHLFMGARYRTVDKPTRLTRNGNEVTDIDAAILDVETGTLALFQLKWQDFNTNDVRSQRSKAKNFISQIDKWADAIDSWLSEFGVETLLRLLRIDLTVTRVRLFAIGRSAARFRSYGYSSNNATVVCSSWLQFVRLRIKAANTANVFDTIADEANREELTPLKLNPIPYEISISGRRILFEDMWCEFDDAFSSESPATTP